MQGPVCQLLSEYFAQTPFQPVPDNSVAYFSVYRKAEPAVIQSIRQCVYNNEW